LAPEKDVPIMKKKASPCNRLNTGVLQLPTLVRYYLISRLIAREGTQPHHNIGVQLVAGRDLLFFPMITKQNELNYNLAVLDLVEFNPHEM